MILAGVKPLEEVYRARVKNAVLEIEGEVGAFDPETLPKLLGVRSSQVRRIMARADGGQVQHMTVALARLSSNDLKVAALRLRREPGISDVKVKREGRTSDAETPAS